ncbi:hypothetical protein LTS12_000885 [Elasticomyces elasticus]|nr:hypothetical protein LTS12_000885 [Elasticomyces elasticus]
MTGQVGDNESAVQLIPPATELRGYEAGSVEGQRRRKLETLLIEEPASSESGQASSSRSKSAKNIQARASLLRLWWAELLAASFSLACVIVQSGLLRALDGKTFGTWRLLRSDINPNTLISILATLNRSSLLLYVTQGIAQLKWPYFQRRIHRLSDLQVFDDASRGPLGSLYLLWSVNIKATMACLGAMIVVLALLMEPFTQQIIAPYTFLETALNESASIAATSIYVVDGGFGICSSCQNITLEAQVSCGRLRLPLKANNSDMPAGVGMCTYTLPSDFGEDDFFWTLWSPEYSKDGSKGYYSSTWWNTTVNAPDGERASVELANITNLIFDPYTFNESHVESGTLYDHATSNVPVYLDATIRDYDTETYAAWTGQHAFSLADLQSWISEPARRPNEAYIIDSLFADSIPDILADALTYTYYNDGTNEWDGGGVANTTAQLNTLNSLVPSRNATQGNILGWSQQVFEGYDSSNISATLDNVAVALTNHIRRSSNATSVQGAVHRPTIYIRIRWVWFIYPASISALSIVFLALVMTVSHRKGELVWKASSAAIAFHGLERDQDSGVILVDTLKISEAAKSQWVKLAADDDGKLALRAS